MPRSRLLLIAGAVVLVAAGGLGVRTAQRYLSLHRALTQFGDIKIGTTQDEVHYRIGIPDQVHQTAERVPDAFGHNYYPKSDSDQSPKISEEKIIEFDGWDFWGQVKGQPNPYAGDLTIAFKNGKVAALECWEAGDGYCKLPILFNIDTPEEAIRRSFGEPASESIDHQGFKTITYPDLGLELTLSMGKVFSFKIWGLQPGVNWRLLNAALF